MRSFVRLLLLVAAFAYGAMPFTGMAAMAMPAVSAASADQAQAPAAHAADIDCPHAASADIAVGDAADDGHPPAKAAKTAGHCAACLTLPAHGSTPDSARPARAAEPARLQPQFVSRESAPLTPPPRC